jgi:DNA adenine methylase
MNGILGLVWCENMALVEPKPFLKWAGGKRQLLNDLLRYSPSKFNDYYEPFLGGGALFFKLASLGRIKRAHLNDNSKILIDAYATIKEHPQELVAELKSGKYVNQKEVFYDIRREQPKDLIKATARLLYLNKTAFNGLYRVNSQGKFNVPFGKYVNPKILDEQNIIAVSKALQTDELMNTDFEMAVKNAKRGDFIYFDPPYYPLSKTANFTGYTKEDFTVKDQERLARNFSELDKKGCLVMLSNSYVPAILELYNGFTINTVQATRMINCKADGRGKIKEVIITNYSNYLPR